jgi:hypothetical protein
MHPQIVIYALFLNIIIISALGYNILFGDRTERLASYTILIPGILEIASGVPGILYGTDKIPALGVPAVSIYYAYEARVVPFTSFIILCIFIYFATFHKRIWTISAAALILMSNTAALLGHFFKIREQTLDVMTAMPVTVTVIVMTYVTYRHSNYIKAIKFSSKFGDVPTPDAQ